MTRRRGKEDDEVEQMLQAAQDEMLLKLSVDSHTSRGSSSDFLDPDLHSRFLALKSKPSKNKNNDQKRRPRSPPKLKDVKETPEDIMLRFAALKTSLPSSSSSVSPSVRLSSDIGEETDDIGEDAEVEKLIQWAMDAARLDPSPPSDDDDDKSSDNDDDDKISDDDDDHDNGSKRDVKP